MNDRRLRTRLVLAVLAALAVLGAPASPAQPGDNNAAERLDALVRLGDDWPDRALAALASWPAGSAAEQRLLGLARAEIAQRSGTALAAEQARAAASQASAGVGAALQRADQQYLAALRAELQGSAGAVALAEDALARYSAWCDTVRGTPPAAAGSAAVASSGAGGSVNLASAATSTEVCELRPRWRLHHLLSLRASSQKADDSARSQARAGLELARAADDSWRQAWSEAQLAGITARAGEPALSQQHLARAQALARRSGEPGMQALVTMVQGLLASQAGQNAQALAWLQQAQRQAAAAQAARLEAVVLGNLADMVLQRGEPREAVRLAEAGRATALRLGDQRIARVLQHNAMMARLALGQTEAAQRDLDELQAAWAAEGATGVQVQALREFADALAARGDATAALAIHHRERALNQQLMQANRASAMDELRGRYNREAQQREMQLLASDNAVNAAELTRQALSSRLWLAGGAAVALALLLTALLVLRVRETQRQLRHSRASLREQSERDALTGLANRRHGQAVLQRMSGPDGQQFSGALLMLDIDHFKTINDERGHGVGDAVLVATAQRLAATVRAQDTVARWGGEEFLVLAPGLGGDELAALAQRLLQAVAGSPVRVDGAAPLRVTASIGHASFALPPHAVPLRAEQAVNLVDMALYMAKSQGRNRAVGITAVQAADGAALRALEADFERGCSEGRVSLQQQAGPA